MDIGPATEALLRAAFAEKALITANETARLLGLDEKTLRTLVNGGAIRSVLVGRSSRRFAEADLRAFLSGETSMPPRELRGRSTANVRSRRAQMGFTEARELRKAERAAQRKETR